MFTPHTLLKGQTVEICARRPIYRSEMVTRDRFLKGVHALKEQWLQDFRVLHGSHKGNSIFGGSVIMPRDLREHSERCCLDSCQRSSPIRTSCLHVLRRLQLASPSEIDSPKKDFFRLIVADQLFKFWEILMTIVRKRSLGRLDHRVC